MTPLPDRDPGARGQKAEHRAPAPQIADSPSEASRPKWSRMLGNQRCGQTSVQSSDWIGLQDRWWQNRRPGYVERVAQLLPSIFFSAPVGLLLSRKAPCALPSRIVIGGNILHFLGVFGDTPGGWRYFAAVRPLEVGRALTVGQHFEGILKGPLPTRHHHSRPFSRPPSQARTIHAVDMLARKVANDEPGAGRERRIR